MEWHRVKHSRRAIHLQTVNYVKNGNCIVFGLYSSLAFHLSNLYHKYYLDCNLRWFCSTKHFTSSGNGCKMLSTVTNIYKRIYIYVYIAVKSFSFVPSLMHFLLFRLHECQCPMPVAVLRMRRIESLNMYTVLCLYAYRWMKYFCCRNLMKYR